MCVACGEQEGLEHILFDCSVAPVRVIKRILGSFLRGGPHPPPLVSFGLLLGAPLFSATPAAAGATPWDELCRAVLMESAYLLWVLRCERAIGMGGETDRWHTPEQVRERWLATMRTRARTDWAARRVRTRRKVPSRDSLCRKWRWLFPDFPDLRAVCEPIAGVFSG